MKRDEVQLPDAFSHRVDELTPRHRLIRARFAWKFSLLCVLLVCLAWPSSLYATPFYADVDGDGYTDEISLNGYTVTVFHPHTGGTSTYEHPDIISLSITSYTNDTDGIAGNEIIILYTRAYTSTKVIEVIHDRTGTRNTYEYPGMTALSISYIEEIDGTAGQEIIALASVPGQVTVGVIHDEQTIQNTYAYSAIALSISNILDTDGITGNEIIILYTRAYTTEKAIDVIHDTTMSRNTYDFGVVTGLAINGYMDYDGVAGNEICVRWWIGANIVYNLIVDRTEMIEAGCNIAPPPSISVTPSSQDFGSIYVGATADRTFTVQNTGGGTLSGSASVPSPYSIVSGGTYSLLAGATSIVTVRYSPTAVGTHNQTVTFTGGGGASRSVSGTAMPVPTAPTITTPSPLPNGTVGTAYNQMLTASGGTSPYTWSLFSGSLPSGLSLSSSGVISGTPIAGVTANITIQVTGNDLLSSTKDFSLTIDGPPMITTPSPLPNGTVGTAYNQMLTASGGTSPYTWSLFSGSLPSGLSLSSSGVISGTPIAGIIANITIQVTGNDLLSSTKDFSLTIAATAVTTWLQRQKLLASDGETYDGLGSSVSISGNLAIVGAMSDDDNGSSSGSAYIFKFNGTNWIEQQKLTASDGAASDYFGYSVSISGDLAIVGAPYDDDNGSSSGSAYIFTPNDVDPNNWDQQRKLLASDGATSDYFGYSVSISGDSAIVGADSDDDNGDASGSAYIFTPNDVDPNNWDQQQKLLASDGAAYDGFGGSVSISGDSAIVGADGDDDNGDASGSAYIFKWNGTSWVEQQKLLASDGAVYDGFGGSVSISGNVVIIGAAFDDDNGHNSGSAYIFTPNDIDPNNWYEQTKLLASDGAAEDWFSYGYSGVSVSGNYAIVGAREENNTFGSAYLFKQDGASWVQQQKLLTSDGAYSDYFGNAVSISGDLAIAVAPGDDDNGSSSGSAYIFGPCPYTIAGDIDEDCKIDLSDFAVLAKAWLSEAGDVQWSRACDISDPNDDIINELDLDVFCGNWLIDCIADPDNPACVPK